VTLSSGPFTAGLGWAGWVIVAVIVVAFWGRADRRDTRTVSRAPQSRTAEAER
jgi:hypothetical protein